MSSVFRIISHPFQSRFYLQHIIKFAYNAMPSTTKARQQHDFHDQTAPMAKHQHNHNRQQEHNLFHIKKRLDGWKRRRNRRSTQRAQCNTATHRLGHIENSLELYTPQLRRTNLSQRQAKTAKCHDNVRQIIRIHARKFCLVFPFIPIVVIETFLLPLHQNRRPAEFYPRRYSTSTSGGRSLLDKSEQAVP